MKAEYPLMIDVRLKSVKKPTPADWHTKQTAQQVAETACDIIVKLATTSINKRGCFKCVLAGGTTPQKIYEMLATKECKWQFWHLYIGDERCLDKNDPDRNSVMIRKTWLEKVVFPEQNISFIAAEQGPDNAAKMYGKTVREAVPFDLVMLGMGKDGHTASLFPGHEYDDDEWVHAVHGSPKPPSDRVSLSAGTLSLNENLLIIITGASKRQAVKRWRSGAQLPIAKIGTLGKAVILLDSKAGE